MNRILAGVAVATVAGLTACGGSGHTPATSHTTVPSSVSAAKAVTATQVAAAAGGTSCKGGPPRRERSAR